MAVFRNIIIFILIIGFTSFAVYSQEQAFFFSEHFNDLSNWKPITFPKIKKHSSYSVESYKDNSYLKAESNSSASGLAYVKEFDVYKYPRVRWRWRTEGIYDKGNAKTREGDDFSIRVYIMFKYDPKNSGFWEKVIYNSARLIYGEYPPHSSLNYIWANMLHEDTVITSRYTDRAKMILLQKGKENLGKWVVQDVNIIEDYQRAFGTMPPNIGSIAIMNDSDNTGESSISYMDYIEVYRMSE
ncbi:MAG: DUF3047 domain-containing protein [Desulfobacterales bacterium]|nr:DUF3047 domain-containing protein [Desulfobacterales bacterium]